MDRTEPAAEDELLAAELALGVADDAERSLLEARRARDPAFADLVTAWEERMAPMLSAVPACTPPADLWPRIRGQVAAMPVAMHRRLRRWQAATGAASALAAGLALALAWPGGQPEAGTAPAAPSETLPPQTQAQGERQPGAEAAVPAPAPAPAPEPTPAVLPALAIAQLVAEDGEAVIAVGIERGSGEVRVRRQHLSEGRRVPELWVIPEGGRPRSLGLIRADGSLASPMPPAALAELAADATLAVSLEQASGAPHDAPAGPIVATGAVVLF